MTITKPNSPGHPRNGDTPGSAAAPGGTPAGASRVLDNLTTSVLTFDSSLRLTSINAAGQMLFEVSAKKVLGQTVADLLPHAPALVTSLQSVLATHHPFTARGVRLRTGWGHAVTVDCTVTPTMPSVDDNALVVELTQVDRLLRLAREEGRADRQAANRAVLRGLAHEIKNPLGGLRGAAQLLERELPSSALREYTQVIIHEADRLRNLVDRLSGPIQPLRQEPVNVHEVMEHVRKLIEAEFPGISVARHYDPSLPERAGDREQLIQATLNIARNAAQALAGSGHVVLATRIERGFTIAGVRRRLTIRIDIEDNGPGIDPALQDHIFYPMVTGRPEGTGLGLAISQDILHRHGGMIEFSSRPGKTVFSLYLPLEESNEQG